MNDITKTPPEQASPDKIPAEQARPEQTQPEQTPSEQANPEQARPEQAQPEQARPEQARPERVIIHYGEIGLKGKNRSVFELRLIENMAKKLRGRVTSIKRESGQLVAQIAEDADIDEIKDILIRVPGVVYFSLAIPCPNDIESLKKTTLQYLEKREFTTFRISAKRRVKTHPLNSMEINRQIGAEVVIKLGKKVKLEDPEVTVKIEISHDNAYFSDHDIYGVGGMPTNSRNRVVTLLSGGFDSPVAAYMMMKRGCRVTFVHFQNRTQMTQAVQGKVNDLAKQLSRYQIKTRLYICPFEELQKEIIMCVPAAKRMLVYRRFMLRIAAIVARKAKARFLVTGDSLSQVASQTLDNLEAVYKSTNFRIFTPLIGMDKKEIINISKKIDCFDISAQPYGDCCSFFVPKHPELRGKARDLEAIEENIDLEPLIQKAVKEMEVFDWES